MHFQPPKLKLWHIGEVVVTEDTMVVVGEDIMEDTTVEDGDIMEATAVGEDTMEVTMAKNSGELIED